MLFEHDYLSNLVFSRLPTKTTYCKCNNSTIVIDNDFNFELECYKHCRTYKFCIYCGGLVMISRASQYVYPHELGKCLTIQNTEYMLSNDTASVITAYMDDDAIISKDVFRTRHANKPKMTRHVCKPKITRKIK